MSGSSPSQYFYYSPFLKTFLVFFPSKNCTFIFRCPVSSLSLPWERRQKGQALVQLYNELAHGACCTGAKWLHPASSRDFHWGRRKRREPDMPCKGHWCQGFPSQTLQLLWAILQLWPPWGSGTSAEWRRKSSPVVQFPQCATGKVKGQVATQLVLGTTDHHSHGLRQWWGTLKKRS